MYLQDAVHTDGVHRRAPDLQGSGVVVADVLFCGMCKPQPEPIEMPESYQPALAA